MSDNKKYLHSDIEDSEKDKAKIAGEETILDLPDVEDIPGQENIKVPRFKEFADTTISSADEEGEGIFNDDESSDVTSTERQLLKKSALETPGDETEADVSAMTLDDRDDDGELLNEGKLSDDRFGKDLDLPESEEVDEEE